MTPTVFLIVGVAALGAGIVLAVIGITARAADGGVARALAAIDSHYTRHAPTAAETATDPFAALPGWLRGLAVRLSPSGISATLQRRLDLAGNPSAWTPDRVLAAKGLGLFILGGLGGLYGLRTIGLLIVGAAVAATAGFFLPDMLLYNAGIKRQEKIQKALPDALDMLTVCVEAGLGFDAALAQVARNTTGPLAAELSRVLQEVQIGKSRSQALRALTERTTVPELRSFVSALVQAGELGITIADVLREQAKEMRLRRRQRAEEKAQKVPVKILFPLVFCLFPSMFIVIIGPGVISIVHVFFGK
ncbi:type II secretion system F family protein [Kribbella pratensis]|uniref:Tight adherence protein C n=1 Tax=Kribbella pratensis TaxID=2512112 RepID=A0A4V3GFG3_9ACTN|nr:type II secretion system F family protein [Kribbella pratensis]TDW66649.1 tight adherence protein C [Kribbella pratensis]